MNGGTILEIVYSALIVVGIWGASNHRKWWLVYGVGDVLFVFYMVFIGKYWTALMGFLLGISAVKNYIKEGQKGRKNK